jgi:hypothetical protein
MIGRALRLIAAVAVVVTMVVAVPASASNSMSFTDPTEGGTAPDLTTVRVTNDDDGGVDFEITVLGKPRLSPGDFVAVFADTDQNPSTGNPQVFGSDTTMTATGTASTPQYNFCLWENNAWKCQTYSQWTDTSVSATSHVLRIGLTLGTKRNGRMNFTVGSSFTDPTTKAQTFDRAPDAATWVYNVAIVQADADRDGVRGSADKCPQKHRGQFDRNRNGCPGPYPLINPEPRNPGFASGGSTTFTSVVFRSIPPGAKVVITASGLKETLRASSAGRAPSQAMKRPWRDGAIITVRITKPGYVGYHGQFRVGPPSGLNRVKRLCVPATGRQTAVRCTKALRGS